MECFRRSNKGHTGQCYNLKGLLFTWKVKWLKTYARLCTYVWHNTVTHSCNVCTSSATLAARYHFTERQRLYGDLMAPATINHTYIFGAKCPIFLSDGNQISSLSTDFNNFHTYHENPSSGSPADTCGRTATTKVTGTWREYANDKKMELIKWRRTVP